MYNLFPECKIIITLREPVGWIQSFGNMLMRNDNFYTNYNDFDEYIEKTRQNIAFTDCVKNYLEVFGEQNVRIYFYDDLVANNWNYYCLLYTSPSPRDKRQSRMPSSA